MADRARVCELKTRHDPPNADIQSTPQRLGAGKIRRPLHWLWVGLAWLVLASGAWWFSGNPAQALAKVMDEAPAFPWESSNTAFWRVEFEPRNQALVPDTQDPEQLIREILGALKEGQQGQALSIAEQLSARFPNFQLGQLLYADLLNVTSSAPMAWSDKAAQHTPATKKRLDELTLEFERRLRREDTPHLQGKIPSAVLFLGAKQPHIVAIDTSKSRFYLFENRPTPDGSARLHLVKERYVSVGINGIGKYQEGDGKTPIGVYFFLKNLPGKNLPDLYGAGALTLNYPNAVDVMRQKTGSGIWLHGTPSAQFARAPESTDGCLVLANPDMANLLQLPDLRMTPVVIAEHLDWVPQDQESQAFASFKPVLDLWLQSRKGQDIATLKSLYSKRFVRDGKNLDHWWPRLTGTSASSPTRQPLELVSALQWQDEAQNMVVTLKDPRGSSLNGLGYLRTYWQKENGQWRVVYEGPT